MLRTDRDLIQPIQHPPSRPERKPMTLTTPTPLPRLLIPGPRKHLLIPLHGRRSRERNPHIPPPISKPQIRPLRREVVFLPTMAHLTFHPSKDLTGKTLSATLSRRFIHRHHRTPQCNVNSPFATIGGVPCVSRPRSFPSQ